MPMTALAANETLSREQRIERLSTMRGAYQSWADEMDRQIEELRQTEPEPRT